MNRLILVVIAIVVVLEQIDGRRHHHRRHRGRGHHHHRRHYDDDEPEPQAASSSSGRGFILSGLSAMGSGMKNLLFPDASSIPANQKLATDEINALVQYHATGIVKRGLDFNTENGLPQVEALTYAKVEDSQFDIYLINIIVSNRFFVHAKIGLPHGEAVDPSKSRLISVVGGKSETDKLDMDAFQ